MSTQRCHDRRMFLGPYGDPTKGHTPEQTGTFYGYTVAGGSSSGSCDPATPSEDDDRRLGQAGVFLAGVQHPWFGPLWNEATS